MKATSSSRAVRIGVVLGLIAYVALPWYAVQGGAWWNALPQLTGGADQAGIAQALVQGRKWLLIGIAGLIIAVMSLGQPTPRRADGYLIAGGLIGALGLAAGFWLIGPDGFTLELLRERWGHLPSFKQPAPGAGAWMALVVNAGVAILGINRAAARARAA